MHIVLIEPEIHFNTGNIGRTCVGTGTTLHLVGPLGFSLDSAQIRRSGLDYWPSLELRRHADFPAFLASLPPEPSLLFFSPDGAREHWDAPYEPESRLIFGKESVGLPAELRERYADRLFRVPCKGKIRSLNLSTVAAVALFEGLRRLR